MIVSVVAGGWSVRGDQWNLKRLPGHIIGVNDAALHLPKVDTVVSMDRLWTENRWDWLEGKQLPSWIRDAALKRVPTRGLSWLRVFVCDHKSTELSNESYVLNGTSSGMCGFNLAYKMVPEVIYMFGFDMRPGPNGEQHWYPPYPWKSGHSTKPPTLKRWAEEFHTAARQCREAGIRVFNCSSRSLITDFKRCLPSEVMQ
jgi:hypothetical protein